MDKIILAYASDGSFSGISEGDAVKLTHVNYAFAVIRDGMATAAHWQHADLLKEFIDKNSHVRVCLSVGGWGADGFSQSVSSAEGRELLAESITAIIRAHNLRGVDIDWEYPCDTSAGIAASPDDKPNFTLFLGLMREKLDKMERETGIHYLLTMAVGASEDCARNIEFKKILPYMDFINIMTYDMSPWGGFTGHHSHLYLPPDTNGRDIRLWGEKSIETYHNAGIPYEKMVIGAAFYGRVYKDVEKGGTNGLFQPHTTKDIGFSDYGDIIKRAETTGTLYFDESAKAPYLYDEENKLFITYENEVSINTKTKFAREKGLAGIMFWEYNCEKTGFLLSAVYDGMTE